MALQSRHACFITDLALGRAGSIVRRPYVCCCWNVVAGNHLLGGSVRIGATPSAGKFLRFFPINSFDTTTPYTLYIQVCHPQHVLRLIAERQQLGPSPLLSISSPDRPFQRRRACRNKSTRAILGVSARSQPRTKSASSERARHGQQIEAQHSDSRSFSTLFIPCGMGSERRQRGIIIVQSMRKNRSLRLVCVSGETTGRSHRRTSIQPVHRRTKNLACRVSGAACFPPVECTFCTDVVWPQPQTRGNLTACMSETPTSLHVFGFAYGLP